MRIAISLVIVMLCSNDCGEGNECDYTTGSCVASDGCGYDVVVIISRASCGHHGAA